MLFESVRLDASIAGGVLGAIGGISGCAFADATKLANPTSGKQMIRIDFMLGVLA